MGLLISREYKLSQYFSLYMALPCRIIKML